MDHFHLWVGVAAVYAVLALLYAHGHRVREELHLNSLEAFETRERIIGNLLWCGLGLIAACGAVALGGHRGRWAGYGIFSDSSGRDYPCFDQQTAPREAESAGDKLLG